MKTKLIGWGYAGKVLKRNLRKAYRPPVPVGTKRVYNGNTYVKTVDGWKSEGSTDDKDDKKEKKDKPVKPVKPKKVAPSDVKTANYQ